jgi:hypothetical protein
VVTAELFLDFGTRLHSVVDVEAEGLGQSCVFGAAPGAGDGQELDDGEDGEGEGGTE